MKLYDCKPAPNPRRVRIFMAEKGIEVETVQVDLGNGEQFGEAFMKINPDCAVPVLELDDGSYVSEVFAICHYLEDLQPEPPLLGTTKEERARILMWHGKVEQQGLAAMADAFRNTTKRMKDNAVTGSASYAQIPELAERGRSRVGEFFLKLDKQLADNEFVAGDSYSIADITAMVVVDFAARVKLSLPEDGVNVRRWYDSVSGRPSAAA